MESLIKKNGFTLVEAMLALAVLLVLSVGGVAANQLTTTSVTINQLRARANLLAGEGMEALHGVRAANFLSITSGEFHPVFDGTAWQLSAGSETIDGFTRTITISPVMRDLVCENTVCNIVTQGGISDEGSFMAETRVSWIFRGETRSVLLSSLITYWR